MTQCSNKPIGLGVKKIRHFAAGPMLFNNCAVQGGGAVPERHLVQRTKGFCRASIAGFEASVLLC